MTQRVIKFRCWVHDAIYEDVFFIKSNNRLYDIYQNNNGIVKHVCTCDKDILTLMQFTGLPDKHGKEIYHNDFIKSKCGDIMLVVWRDDLASFALRKKGWAYDHYFGEAVDAGDTEIIGNIYTTPELILL